MNDKEENKYALKDNLGLVSFILGLVTLVINLLPLSIIGLIFGIKSKNNDWKKITGIVLNTITLVFHIIILIIVILFFGLIYNEIKNEGLDYNFTESYNENIANSSDFFSDINENLETNESPAGYYICVNDTNGKKIAFELNDDNTYSYINFENANAEYVNGTYSYELEKSNNNKKYFNLYLEKIINNSKETTKASFKKEKSFFQERIILKFENDDSKYNCSGN